MTEVTVFADRIRESETEPEILALLNIFIETSRAAGKLSFLRAPMVAPVSSFHNLLQRCLSLLGELDAASKRLDDPAIAAIKDVLHTFSIALERLRAVAQRTRRFSIAPVPQQPRRPGTCR